MASFDKLLCNGKRFMDFTSAPGILLLGSWGVCVCVCAYAIILPAGILIYMFKFI